MRREDFDASCLQNYRLIHRTLCAVQRLKVADLDLLLYLYPIEYFTRHDFNDGRFTMSWDKDRFFRLQREGYIKKISDGTGYKGGHSKYVVTQKTKLMVRRLERFIDGREDLPLLKSPKSYSERILNTSINKFNKNKYKDYD